MRKVNDLRVQNEMMIESDQKVTVTRWGVGLYGNFANQSKISLRVILERTSHSDTDFVRITEHDTGLCAPDQRPLLSQATHWGSLHRQSLTSPGPQKRETIFKTWSLIGFF
jgi:hypothetical protein